MSYTGMNSIIYDQNNDIGVKITDPTALTNFISQYGLCMNTEDRREKGKYPYISYLYLYGFKSKITKGYNIDGIALDYSKDPFIDFWSNVSKYTEPFYFHHSPHDNKIKTVFDILESDTEELVYVVNCNIGIITIHKYKISYTMK